MVLTLTPDELLTTTRAVRKRLDLTRTVSPELIRECLEIAVQAPSGSNRQHWHWLVITDPGQRAVVAEYYRRGWEDEYRDSGARDAALPAEPEAVRARERVSASSRYLYEHVAEVPVLVLPCLRLSSQGLPVGNQAGVWGSLLPAAWNYCLAARARGLGTAWTTLHLAYEREVAGALGVPEDIVQGALIPTAHYTGETFRPAARAPLDDVVHIDRW